MMIPRLIITPGEPAGIGPDVLLQTINQSWNAELIAIADPVVLIQRANVLNIPLKLISADLTQTPTAHIPGTLKIIPVTLNTPVIPGELNALNNSYVLNTLDLAISTCLDKKANALVTGPVHKEILNTAGIKFSGHTEYLANKTNSKQTIMLFVVDNLKVALATTHIPLKEVSNAITQEKLIALINLLNTELKNKFKITNPRILVAGLNPHAGEGGYLGREEIDVITPALNQLRDKGLLIEGPLPADTLFTPHMLAKQDVIVGMYHDQVLPLIKHIGFDKAVNVTLGLPFIRTSVDHGTALSLAGTGQANAGSMKEAIKLAIARAI